MTKFLNFSINSKNPAFGTFLAHFLNFGDKNIFSGKSGSITHNLMWNSSTMPKFGKNNYTIPRKHPDRRSEGQKDGQTLFHRTLPATAGGPIAKIKQQIISFKDLSKRFQVSEQIMQPMHIGKKELIFK